MTLVTTRLCEGTGANGGVYFLYATWDSKEEQEDGTFLDPAATGAVSSIRYQNMTGGDKTIQIGIRSWVISPLTPDTTINIPKGQQPSMYTSSWQIF